MPITNTDIHYYRSSNGASAGGTRSPTEIVGVADNNLFDDVSEASALAGGSQTKKWFLRNENATIPMVKPKFWLSVAPQYVAEQIGLGFDDADDDDAGTGNMTAFTASAQVALVSSGPDTRSATIYGLDGSGVPVSESVTLNGITEVLSVGTFSKVWAVKMSAEASETVTVKQGTGGATRGTVAPNKETCFLWVTPTSEATAIQIPDIIAGASAGFWDRLTWSAGTPSVNANESIVSYKEGS